MIDAFSSLSSDLSQMLLTQLIIRCPQPQPDSVMRLLSHISEFSKPHQVIMSEIIRCNLATFIKNIIYVHFRRKLYFLKIVAEKYLILLFAVADTHCWWKVHVHIYAYVTLISVSWYFDLVVFWQNFILTICRRKARNRYVFTLVGFCMLSSWI